MGAADSKEKLEEAVRENRRSISRSVRELDREALALNRLEQQLLSQIRSQAIAETAVLMKVNKTLNLPQLEGVMNDFMHESHRLGLLEEMMTDVIDNATADTEEEEAEEAIVNQVLHSASAHLSHRLAAAPPPCRLDVPVAVGSAPVACGAQSLEPQRPVQEGTGLLRKPRCEPHRVGLPTLLASGGGFGGDTRLGPQGAVCEMEREIEKRLLDLRR
ncbi:putative SNF7 family domain-containing protein [Neospora caninum Liverpool]|uniref:Putative SNF7 family domain-containing protein n=1 Tax=Neospora caninum (strain Liverpool) TaxID=572307 RepID=F0VCU3_NEOCL|nr:putative SNF7 family domain-containing protein [Neospora caninum Liverpool]CBZ51458.1 putative SNF7 family domain-containing protein [Neospora caninum Liverpool]|eukprot:XP_003881491.1 putative SNF7 family domain-containing protein [Neospora caninum Liverpool]